MADTPEPTQFLSNKGEQARPLSPEEYQKRLRELMQPVNKELPKDENRVKAVEEMTQQKTAESEIKAQMEAISIKSVDEAPEAVPKQQELPQPAEQATLPEQQPPKLDKKAEKEQKRAEEQAQIEAEIADLNLPVSREEIEAGLKAPLTKAIRWLSGWANRQIKKIHPEKYKSDERRSLEMVFMEVLLPKDNEIEINAAETFYANLTSLYKSSGLAILPLISRYYDPQITISLEIVAEPGSITFIVGVPKNLANFMEKQIHSAYPSAEISYVPEYNIFNKEGETKFTEMRVSGPAYYPIKSHEELSTDGLSSITTAMSKLQEGEAAVIQFVLMPVSKSWSDRGKSFVRAAQKPPKEGEEPKQVDQEKIEGIRKKTSKLGLGVLVRIVTVAKTSDAAALHLDNIAGSFEQFSDPQFGSFRRYSSALPFRKPFTENFLYRYYPAFNNESILNVEELATIMHFPNKEIQTPNIKWLQFKRSEPPAHVPDEGLYLGFSEFRGDKKKIHLLPDDRRRHMYILGQTGTGKSEFMMSLAAQDIREGRGLAFIDPHGDGVEELLQVVPKERAEDVIYFDPSDEDRPMGINILEAYTEQQQHMAVNSFIGLLYKLYDPGHTGIIGPQLERAVRNVMLTAMTEPNNSMIEVLRLLIDPEFAKEKIPLIKDPLVKQFWTEEMAQTSDFHKSEKLGYFVSKFDRFVTEKLMRNIIGQSKSAFNFRKVMDEQKILLVNLAKGKIGDENSQFLGLLLVPRILIAAMSRADMPMEERKDFYLYVDEFQNFSTPDFASILSEARKFRLCLIVANQYISQIDEKIRDAVFGNVGTMVTMRAGSDDAQYLEQHFGPTFTSKDIMNLTIGNAYARLLIKGHPSQPFSMYSDYPTWQSVPRNEELAGMVRELSRLRYGRDREVIEAEIKVRAKLED